MKKYLVFLIILASPGLSFGQQVWVLQGAVWHYGFDRGDPALNFGYIRIKSIGDTMIDGKSCKILDQYEVRYRVWYPTPGFDSGSVGRIYTYADSSKVYNWKNNQFYTLYDFGATAGTVWTVCMYNGMVPPMDTGRVKVDAVDYSVINGDTLKTLYVSRMPGSCVGWTSAVIAERMGCMNEYMFPDYDMNCVADIQINGYFRCYRDDAFPLYSVTNSDTICEYILTAVGEKLPDGGKVKISPNPSSDYLVIESSEPYWINSTVSLFTAEGRKMNEIVLPQESKKTMDVSSYKPGFYILRIVSGNGSALYKKIIIE